MLEEEGMDEDQDLMLINSDEAPEEAVHMLERPCLVTYPVVVYTKLYRRSPQSRNEPLGSGPPHQPWQGPPGNFPGNRGARPPSNARRGNTPSALTNQACYPPTTGGESG